MEHIIDALNLAGFRYSVEGTSIIVENWNVNGMMFVTYDEDTGWCEVTETWDGHSVTDTYPAVTVEAWITSQARL